MYRVFRTEEYTRKLSKLDHREQERITSFETSLKHAPYTGKPLGYTFFREKKFEGKRLLFLIYEEFQIIFLITITDKKAQQRDINIIKASLAYYRDQITQMKTASRLP